MSELEELERLALEVPDVAVEPRQDECLGHYLDRVIGAYGCASDHRFTRRWAARRVRQDVRGVLAWANRTGGCCCDCEVIMNSLRAGLLRAGVACDALTEWLRACSDEDDEQPWPQPCSGVLGSAASRAVPDLGTYD